MEPAIQVKFVTMSVARWNAGMAGCAAEAQLELQPQGLRQSANTSQLQQPPLFGAPVDLLKYCSGLRANFSLHLGPQK